jgi:5-methylcytosine-specific restriction endonuclease McrBC GTP-binding regulatory subunit McrB
MTEVSAHELWSEFLAAWPLQRVQQMTLEEYTNPDKDDAFIYWVEARLEDLGSIWGSSAFKFGIYYRANTEIKEGGRGRVYGEKYAWRDKYGKTEQEAFATVRSLLVEVIEAVGEGNLARVEEVDLSPMFKWKVAFLYQDRKRPILFPVFAKDALFRHYRLIDPTAKLVSTPYHVMYETLLEKHRDLGDVFAVAEPLWRQYEADRTRAPRAWAVPLSWIVDPTAVESLCSKNRVEPEDVDPFLENLLAQVELAAGDQLALLVEGDIRALGTVTSAEPGQYAWDQVPVNFPSGLLVNPTSEVRELNAAERQEIWSHAPSRQPSEAPSAAPHYWKIAPGRNAVGWPEWRDRGIASIGWPELGDLSRVNRTEFDKRAAKCAKEHDYNQGMVQVWTFRGIRPGDRIVANQGKHTVLGIGTVVGGYRYSPGTHLVDGEDYPHQVTVTWDDTTPRPVEKYGWQRTIVELSKEDFDALLEAPLAQPPKPPQPEPAPAPCEPRNVILYGPPGTGKTYSTVRRGLELILGRETLKDLRDEKLLPLFRDHQARGQIEFVTFHQAYGYEEFVEGIRPVLDQGADAQVRYEVHDGVFKRIALRAAAEGLRMDSAAPEFDELWDLLLRDLRQDETRTAQSQSGKTYQLSLSNQGNVQVSACEVDSEGNVLSVSDKHQTASKENARLYWKHRTELGPEPEKLTYEKTTALFSREKGGGGGNHYTALWLVYSQLYTLNRTAAGRKSELIDRVARVQQALDKPGPTTTFSFSVKSPQYVLIVDEINRGNMSKILGELITLLEVDKRLASRNELKLPLAYSPQHRFAVPPNLHVLGTMNTADRSIALMDVALRRRFTFEELMPSSDIIRDVLRARVPNRAFIDLVVDVFDTLNSRIRFLYDRDHQLGHSYFLDVADVQSLRQMFVDRIIPMLQEYFYGAWDKICVVLGCPYGESGEPRRRAAHLLQPPGGTAYAVPIVTASPFTESSALGFDHDDYEDRLDYQLRGVFSSGSLPDEGLYRTFLSVLDLAPSDYEERLRLLSQPNDARLVNGAEAQA